MEGVSKQLQAAMSEIDVIMKRYDIAGAVFLSDGKKCGEFKTYFHAPTWSMIRYIPKKDGSMVVHTKVHMKSNPKDTQRTINALYNTQGMIQNIHGMIAQIAEHIESHVEVVKEEGKIIPGNFTE